MDSAQLPKLLLTSLETAVTLISTCEQKEKNTHPENYENELSLCCILRLTSCICALKSVHEDN